MLARTDTAATIAESWLVQFEAAFAAPSQARLKTLFRSDSYWRDVLALTWHIKTVNGSDGILRELATHAGRARPRGFKIDLHRTAPRNVTRAGTDAIEAIFSFETTDGRGSGVLRLTPDADDGDAFKAWTLLTSLDEIKGHEERLGRSRPEGKVYSRDFRGPNWLDLRRAAAEYGDRDPGALVVGGGQAGLSIAARLAQLGVDTLLVDREARIGDNWRKRYHALVLHNQVHVNHLPYMPFPTNWPTYIPKDKLAAWFEAYVESMELNYWAATEFEGGSYDEKAKRWSVVVRRADGPKRQMHPRHVVMATLCGLASLNVSRATPGTSLFGMRQNSGEHYCRNRSVIHPSSGRHRGHGGDSRP
jgi:NAD(P)-binding Rossmann-like domain